MKKQVNSNLIFGEHEPFFLDGWNAITFVLSVLEGYYPRLVGTGEIARKTRYSKGTIDKALREAQAEGEAVRVAHPLRPGWFIWQWVKPENRRKTATIENARSKKITFTS